ncbi:energy-coupling factor transporter transmembrane component T family protein [Candidatus Harpocratesius sp.]
MSLKITQTFNFMKKTTFFHSLDPRTKGLIILLYGTLVMVVGDLFTLLMVTIFAISIMIISGLGTKLIEGIQSLWLIYLLIFIINSYMQSLNLAFILILRFFNFMMVFAVFFQTTMPEDLSQSLIQIHVPYNMAFTLSLAFRFIPTMAQETENIIEAQKSRGHQFNKGGLFQQARNFFPLLIPLIIGSIRRAFHVAEALETRGFGVLKKPTFYRKLQMNRKDWLVLSCLSLIVVIAIILEILQKQNQILIPWRYNLSI